MQRIRKTIAASNNGIVLDDGRTNVIYARRSLRIWIISSIIVLLCIQLLFSIVNSTLFTPVSNDDKKIDFVIPSGSSISETADLLYDNGFIKNALVFKLYSQLTDKGYKLESGTYELSKNMSMEEILDTITRGESERHIIKLIITEGKSIDAEATQLVSNGLLSSTKEFYTLTDNPDQYIKDYPFLSGITNASQRKHFLEGYLFPDTYQVYADSSSDTIIRKQLNRFNSIFTPTYVERAKNIGMTMDQVIILASIIEKEAKVDDFKKVSAVFP